MSRVDGPAPAGPALARTLIRHNLADEYRLMIEPVTLGGGKRLFPDDGEARPLEVVSATTAKTGVQICTYRPVARAATTTAAA